MRYCPRCAQTLVDLALAGRERRACPDPACGWVHWDNPLPVVAAIVEHLDSANRILLARNRAWEKVFFGLITGFVERGESAEQAVAREVKEEVGLDTTATSLVGVYDFQRKNELIIAYHVKARGEIVLNEELCDYRLIAPQKLQPWDAGTGLAVRDWLAGLGLGK
ncbi:MAG: NUDIX hydrolase [Georgfuchsia sp.]